jgi:hypothetical protein
MKGFNVYSVPELIHLGIDSGTINKGQSYINILKSASNNSQIYS